MSVVEVRSGFLDLAAPTVDDVKIEDIGHSLANQCRFNGHTSHYYSVAEHSVIVWALARDHGCSIRTQFACLMHDAHEAYTGDLSTMFKRILGVKYARTVAMLNEAISGKFGIHDWEFETDEVVRFDQWALAIEAYWLMLSKGQGEHWKRLPIVPLPALYKYKPQCLNPHDAKELFMGVYNALVTQQKRLQTNMTATYAV